MTKKETAMILATLKAAYPSFYRDMSQEDAMAAANLWYDLFSDSDYTLVRAAVKALIKTRTSTFPPVPGEVTEQIQKLLHPGELDAQEAFDLVRHAAVHGSPYDPQEAFYALPDAVQRVVGSPAQLKAWMMVSEEEFETVVASNFRRAWDARRKSDREWEALPAGSREVAQAIAAGVFKQLPEGTV